MNLLGDQKVLIWMVGTTLLFSQVFTVNEGTIQQYVTPYIFCMDLFYG